MDESILDADQVENLIKFCPTKHEMELLMNYTGHTDTLHKCEQFFLELMKVPRAGSKLKYCLLKVQSDIQKNLNQGTTRCSAAGLKLESLLEPPAPAPPSRGSTPPMFGGAPSPPPPSFSQVPPPPPPSPLPNAPFPPPPMPIYGAPSSPLYAAGGHPPPPPPPPPPMRGPPPPPPRSYIIHGNPPPRAPAPPPLPPPQLGRRLAHPAGVAATPRRPMLKFHTSASRGSLWEELQRPGEPQSALDFYVSELETQFSAKKDTSKGGGRQNSTSSIPEKERLAAALAMDLYAYQVENLIKFCRTKEEVEFLTNYTGDTDILDKREQPPPPGPPRPPGVGPAPPPPGRAPGPAGIAGAPRKPIWKPFHWSKVTRVLQGSFWEELQRPGEPQSAPDFDVSELETLFSFIVPKKEIPEGRLRKSTGSKSEKVHLINVRKANNTEIMLTKVKMPLPDMMAAALAMDESILDADQVKYLLMFTPTKDEQELLKNYTGDWDMLGKCEQYFLELTKVPRVESKLNVFLFKIQFNIQLSEFKNSLNTVNSACDEVRTSVKLKEILKRILFLGNTLNQGTARGSAVGFKLDSLLRLTDTRSSYSKMTLMHYLCKVLASKSPALLDFHVDLVSLESATKIQLKSLAEELQAINKGLEKVKQELDASANDGPVSEVFLKALNQFISIAESEVGSVTNLYSVVSSNAEALALYFGEDPARCPFEQVTWTLWNFVRLFRKALEENYKQAEL